MYKCTECGTTAMEQTNVCSGCGKEGTMVTEASESAAPEMPASDGSGDSEETN